MSSLSVGEVVLVCDPDLPRGLYMKASNCGANISWARWSCSRSGCTSAFIGRPDGITLLLSMPSLSAGTPD